MGIKVKCTKTVTEGFLWWKKEVKVPCHNWYYFTKEQRQAWGFERDVRICENCKRMELLFRTTHYLDAPPIEDWRKAKRL